MAGGKAQKISKKDLPSLPKTLASLPAEVPKAPHGTWTEMLLKILSSDKQALEACIQAYNDVWRPRATKQAKVLHQEEKVQPVYLACAGTNLKKTCPAGVLVGLVEKLGTMGAKAGAMRCGEMLFAAYTFAVQRTAAFVLHHTAMNFTSQDVGTPNLYIGPENLEVVECPTVLVPIKTWNWGLFEAKGFTIEAAMSAASLDTVTMSFTPDADKRIRQIPQLEFSVVTVFGEPSPHAAKKAPSTDWEASGFSGTVTLDTLPAHIQPFREMTKTLAFARCFRKATLVTIGGRWRLIAEQKVDSSGRRVMMYFPGMEEVEESIMVIVSKE